VSDALRLVLRGGSSCGEGRVIVSADVAVAAVLTLAGSATRVQSEICCGGVITSVAAVDAADVGVTGLTLTGGAAPVLCGIC